MVTHQIIYAIDSELNSGRTSQNYSSHSSLGRNFIPVMSSVTYIAS